MKAALRRIAIAACAAALALLAPAAAADEPGAAQVKPPPAPAPADAPPRFPYLHVPPDAHGWPSSASLRSPDAPVHVPPGEWRLPIVHIESHDPWVELRRSLGYRHGKSNFGPLATERVCGAPCDERVGESDHGYVFGGPGITQSKVFYLLGREDKVTYRVRTGNVYAHSAGYAFALLGGACRAHGDRLRRDVRPVFSERGRSDARGR